MPTETIDRLEAFLSSWSNVPGQVLPQGSDASRILANSYMISVDEAMLQAGYKYPRYLDDVRIAGALKTEVLAMRGSERSVGGAA